MSERRIGVYVCHCGGNISDYVDVDKVIAQVQSEPGVVVAKTAMFTCSDATQEEMVKDIQEQHLDGLVVASCSPKLHTFTFREVARRAGLNPYQYTQVNIREQCSWTHTDDHEGATRKAGRLVTAGIARTRLTTPLEPLVVETQPAALVIGGGIAGLRAALGLARIGLSVYLVERAPQLGGWVGGFGHLFPHQKSGRELIARLVDEIRRYPQITVFTNAEVVSKSGSFGNYQADIQVNGAAPATMQLRIGAIVVATGFDTYQPSIGEFGYGIEGVITLPDFKHLVDASAGTVHYQGRPVQDVVYIYCVGSRQPPDTPGARTGCSRYCCAATVHTALEVAALDPHVHQYHLYRDIRAYGKHELMFSESRVKGSVFIKFADDAPPAVERDGATGRLTVRVNDLLSGGEELAVGADLVVLVTGMVPRAEDDLVRVLKLPIGKDGFFNEIHPKLRPVETVVDGVYICGACQGPKTASESVASGLAAVSQSAAVLKKGTATLDPQVATIDAERCLWCGACQHGCPYSAVQMRSLNGKEVASIDPTSCKGCGGCVPLCPRDAIDLQGYTDAQVTAMIDGLLEVRV
jgi:heterodisulfide reductase subunit A